VLLLQQPNQQHAIATLNLLSISRLTPSSPPGAYAIGLAVEFDTL
jgi:hypothetical protein